MAKCKILVVEDEGIIAMDIRNQLEDFGYEVVATAFSGGQAISLATEHKPDLIMMDIVLKGSMDGISAAKIICESLQIPVIFLTAYSDPSTLARAKQVGAYGYLIKPFRPDELHASIEVALYKHRLERKLKESEQWFAKTLHCISDAVIATDSEANIKFMNPVAEALTGLKMNEAIGINITELMTLLTESNRKVIENPVCTSLKNLSVSGLDSATLLVTRSGKEIPIDDGAAPIVDDAGGLLGAVLVFRDVTQRRDTENQLRDSDERFHSAFDSAAIGMALMTITGTFLQINHSLATLFGYHENELRQFTLQKLIQNDDYYTRINLCLNRLMSDEIPTFQSEIECLHKNTLKKLWILLSASLVRSWQGEPQYFIIQIQDITGRKEAEQQLAYIANHDPLTGLFNRSQFHECLSQALNSVDRHENKLAVLFLDLDRFKLINDTLGHRTGDLLLQAVSERLKHSVRVNDYLARLGGDEFVIILSDINHVNDVARIAQKTIEALSKAFTLEGNDIVITTSIGISIYPDDGDNSQSLLMNADAAMYLAKERGKNNFQFYTLEMTARSLERMQIERGLRHALVNDELRLHYQPQMNTLSKQATSVEALVRWQHPEWGLVYPDRFISVAEETGLIVPVGLWVLRTACLQAKAWQEQQAPFTQIAVNLSARQFMEQDLFESIKIVLTETGLNPSSLELEITESAVMKDPKWTLVVLQQLHELGVRLSIDDFGVGYSSLTYLRKFPLHSVKIDRSFVWDIPDNESSMTLVRAIIALAHELKLLVTAEGVETEAQLDFLKAQLCDSLQGYFFSKPLAIAALTTQYC